MELRGKFMNLEVLLNTTTAGQIAKALDAKDKGGADGKIEASVWNAFVADKGGKSIRYSISIENAMKSITTYVVRKNAEQNGNVEELAINWLEAAKKDTNIPSSLNSKYTTPNIENANKTITDEETGNKFIYNNEGYIAIVKDKDGFTKFERGDDCLIDYGMTKPLEEDKNGLIITYNLDGTVKYYKRYQHENGITVEGTAIEYNPDGTVKRNFDVES